MNATAADNTSRIAETEPDNVLTANISNSEFHNLLPEGQELPPGTKSLLGLGLKFCIERPRPYQDLCKSMQEFRAAVNLRCYLELEGKNDPDEDFNPRLYVNSEWKAPPCPNPHAKALDNFEEEINVLRRNLPSYRRFNLRPIQRRALSILVLNKLIIVFPTDKGLGPYVIDRDGYMRGALKEHLTNTANYKRLTTAEAEIAYDLQKKNLISLFTQHKHIIKEKEVTYFMRSFNEKRKKPARRPMFYGLAKVHKDKPSMRPVISSCGSYPEIFSIHTDEMLKLLVQDILITYIISSDQLINTLMQRFPSGLPAGAKLFSIDAVGMYANIDTDHGIQVVTDFMEAYADRLAGIKLPKPFIIGCLRHIMKNNIIKFGDTYWVQQNGAAMGTSCAVNYAFLYMGLLEMEQLLHDFAPWMPFYARFIDDGIGIWLTRRPGSLRAWRDFLARLNNWGKLKWTNTGHVSSLVFLDLTISINANNCLDFQTYRKPMNLYLYLPPHSAHPADVIRSIVFGRTRAYFLHNTYEKDYVRNCYLLAKHLLARGWDWERLSPLFEEAAELLTRKGKPKLLANAMKTRRVKEKEKEDKRSILVFKHPHHPRGITRKQISGCYRNHLQELIPERRFIVAQLRPTNLRDRVCSTALEDIPGANPSDCLIANPQN